MKKMVLAIIALMVSASMMAQNDMKKKPADRTADKTEMVKQRTSMMVERYGLDETQAEKLLALNTEFSDRMAPRMNHGPRPQMSDRNPEGRPQGRPQGRPNFNPGQMDSLRAKMKESREAYEAGLKTIMSEDQFKQYKDDEQQRMQNRGNGHNGRPHRQ